MSWRFGVAIAMLFALSGCDPPGSITVDAPPGPDAPAAPDAYVPPPLVLMGGCQGMTTEISSFAFPETQVGQVATAWFEVPNPLHEHLPITLADPTSRFKITVSGNNDPVRVLIVFTPLAPGPYQAQLNLDHVGQPTVSVPITAQVIAATGGLVANTPSVQFGTQGPFETYVVLRNRSSSTPISLSSAVVSSSDGSPPTFYEDLSMCPAMLQPGDSCNVRVSFEATLPGCHRNTITFHSNANTVALELEGPRVWSFPITYVSGSISSSTAGFSCSSLGGDNCYARAISSPVVVTATPSAGFRFTGWDLGSGCSQEPTCALRPYPQDVVGSTAAFAPLAAKTIEITISGDAAGRVLIFDGDHQPIACERSCTISARSTIRLVAATPSTFAGWTGACSGALQQCNLNALTSDVVVGATFTKDSAEIASLAPPSEHRGDVGGGARFLPGGDIVVATGANITRMTVTGAVLWTRPAVTDDVVTAYTGDIYYLSRLVRTLVLFKRDSAGTLIWSRALVSPAGSFSASTRRLAITSSGDIALVSGGFLRVVSPLDGADRWSVSVADANNPVYDRVVALATDFAGNVAVAVFDDVDQPTAIAIKRYDATGAPVLPDWSIPFADSMAMAFDTQNHLVVRSLDFTLNTSRLTRIAPTGTPVFSTTTSTMAFYPNAVAILPNGNIITGDVYDSSVTVRRFSPSGAPLGTIDKLGFKSTLVSAGLQLQTIATDSTGRVLLSGWHVVEPDFFHRLTVPWVEVLQLP